MDVADIVDVRDIHAGRIAAPLRQFCAQVLRLVREFLARPEIEEDRVGVIVAGDEFTVLAALETRPGVLEQHGHGVARDVPRRVVAAVLVAASGIDEMRQVELVDALGARELEQGRQVVVIVLRHRKAQARLHAAPPAFLQAGERRDESAVAAAETVVRLADAVKAHADIIVADIGDAPGHVGVDQRAVGRQRRVEAEVDGAPGDVEYVGTQQRLAAGQDQHRRARRLDVVHYAKHFVR